MFMIGQAFAQSTKAMIQDIKGLLVERYIYLDKAEEINTKFFENKNEEIIQNDQLKSKLDTITFRYDSVISERDIVKSENVAVKSELDAAKSETQAINLQYEATKSKLTDIESQLEKTKTELSESNERKDFLWQKGHEIKLLAQQKDAKIKELNDKLVQVYQRPPKVIEKIVEKKVEVQVSKPNPNPKLLEEAYNKSLKNSKSIIYCAYILQWKPKILS